MKRYPTVWSPKATSFSPTAVPSICEQTVVEFAIANCIASLMSSRVSIGAATSGRYGTGLLCKQSLLSEA